MMFVPSAPQSSGGTASLRRKSSACFEGSLWWRGPRMIEFRAYRGNT